LYLNRTGSGSNQYRTTKASQKEAAAAFSETLAQFLDQGAKGNEIRFRVCLLDEADSLDGVEECTWSEWSDYRQF